jgi:arylsulfatase A-like enzyme
MGSRFRLTRRAVRGAARITTLFLAALCVSAPRRAVEPPPRAALRKNLLIVVVDTLRFDKGEKGAGSERSAIPPSLRDRGVHFLNALSTGIHTKPSMMALFTGFYPSESGLIVNGAKVLKPPGPMLAERLRRAGFATAALVSNPNLVGQGLGFDRGFEEFDANMTGFEPNRPTRTRNATGTTNAAIRVLDTLSTRSKPWFLWVHYLEPHGPYRPPSTFLNRPAEPGASLPVSKEDFAPKGAIPRYQYLPECRGTNDYAARYRGFADYSLSEAERFLRHGYSSGKLRNTVVVFTSDHGELLGEQNYWFQHAMRIDPSLFHVPLVIVRSPDERRSEEPRVVGQIDLVATLLPILTGRQAQATRGEDLFDSPTLRRNPLLVEYLALPDYLEMAVADRESVIVRSNREPTTEFRRSGNGSWLAGAPSERDLRRATEVLRPHLVRIRKTPFETHKLTPEEILILRSLGYVGFLWPRLAGRRTVSWSYWR